jgi:hypothetical protein
MSRLRQFAAKWGALIAATLGAAAIPGALLTDLAASDAPSPPPVLVWIAVWCGFTLLIASVLAAGIFRMTYSNDGGDNDTSPWQALGAMVAVIAICSLSVVPIVGFGLTDVKYLLLGTLAIAVAVALFIVRPRRPPNTNPPDNAQP